MFKTRISQHTLARITSKISDLLLRIHRNLTSRNLATRSSNKTESINNQTLTLESGTLTISDVFKYTL